MTFLSLQRSHQFSWEMEQQLTLRTAKWGLSDKEFRIFDKINKNKTVNIFKSDSVV